METPRPFPDDPGPGAAGGERAAAAPPRDDLRGLRRLRDRIEAAVEEVERLRTENAALAARVAALEAGGGDGSLPLDLSAPGAADALRQRLDGFIEAIDQALREPAPEAATAPRAPEAP